MRLRLSTVSSKRHNWAGLNVSSDEQCSALPVCLQRPFARMIILVNSRQMVTAPHSAAGEVPSEDCWGSGQASGFVSAFLAEKCTKARKVRSYKWEFLIGQG